MRKKRELPEVEPVKLKPIFGIRPGIYLLALYVVIIIFSFFLVALMPGIMQGGKYVNFSSPVSDAGLWIDDVYQGPADYQYFVSSGNHLATVKKADQIVGRKQITIGHPILLTWLIHRTQDEHISLETISEGEKEAILCFDLDEIARYSAIAQYDNVTIYPPLFSNLKRDMDALGVQEYDLLVLASSFIGSKEMAEEAKSIPCNDPLYQKAIEVFGQNYFMGEPAANIDVQGKRTLLEFGSFSQTGISYPETTFVMGERSKDYAIAGIKVTTKSFAIATTLVTRSQWALFMEENPAWRKDAAPIEGYLDGISSMDNRAVTGVNFEAAKAFCDWLSVKSGKEVFLPSEAEWSLAAMSSRNKPSVKSLLFEDDGTNSPSGMLSSLWEITSTPFIPLARVTDYDRMQNLARRYNLRCDRILKGGMINDKQAGRQLVGTIREEDASERVGFRIAWREK